MVEPASVDAPAATKRVKDAGSLAGIRGAPRGGDAAARNQPVVSIVVDAELPEKLFGGRFDRLADPEPGKVAALDNGHARACTSQLDRAGAARRAAADNQNV